MQKLKTVIDKQQEQLSEATRAKNSVQKLVESREREIRVIKESAERKEVLVGLLGTLNKEKATVMRELLENVQTEKLKSAFDKYLPAVLNSAGSAKEKAPAILSESRVEFTGDKSAKVTATATSETNVVELRRLAGLK